MTPHLALQAFGLAQENISALVPSAYSLQSDEAEFVAAHFELEN